MYKTFNEVIQENGGPLVWTGEWPGTAECREYGWLHSDGSPDLNKLFYAKWDRQNRRWLRFE
jgi:hypothetical protein